MSVLIFDRYNLFKEWQLIVNKNFLLKFKESGTNGIWADGWTIVLMKVLNELVCSPLDELLNKTMMKVILSGLWGNDWCSRRWQWLSALSNTSLLVIYVICQLSWICIMIRISARAPFVCALSNNETIP